VLKFFLYFAKPTRL